MNAFDLDEYVMEYHNLSLKRITEMFEMMVSKRQEISLNINKNLGNVKKSSERNHEYAREIIKNNK